MFIGIDIGTSSIKSVLVDGDDRIIASESAPQSVSRPRDGWSEQNADDWWDGVTATIDALARKHPVLVSAVEGIGLSGQQHGATVIDDAGRPVRPCILWNDGRATVECEEIERDIPDSRAITGNMAMAAYTAPKIMWLAKHEPETIRRLRKVLLPKDYIRLCLSGDYASDMSDSSGTLWLDVAKRDWSDRHLEYTGLSRENLPTLQEGNAATGSLRRDLVKRWGMAKAPVIAGGGGDNAAAACGVGVVTDGAASASIGTSGVLFVSNDRFSPNPDNGVHAMCHALPGVWHQMGVILSAAAAMEWWSSIAGQPAHELTAAVDTPTAPSMAVFVPYLGGERTPHNDMSLRATFVGLSHLTTRPHMTQAVMEGVAYAFRDSLDGLKDAGTVVPRVMALGGGSRSRVWLQILASVLGVPVDVPQDGDFGGAFGAARLGRLAATGENPADVLKTPPIRAVIEPIAALVPAYAEGVDRYRRALAATRL